MHKKDESSCDLKLIRCYLKITPQESLMVVTSHHFHITWSCPQLTLKLCGLYCSRWYSNYPAQTKRSQSSLNYKVCCWQWWPTSNFVLKNICTDVAANSKSTPNSDFFWNVLDASRSHMDWYLSEFATFVCSRMQSSRNGPHKRKYSLISSEVRSHCESTEWMTSNLTDVASTRWLSKFKSHC